MLQWADPVFSKQRGLYQGYVNMWVPLSVRETAYTDWDVVSSVLEQAWEALLGAG
jgi:hypothetical protein